MLKCVFNANSFFQRASASLSSAMPENMRMGTLHQEMVRRMMNTSELLDAAVRVGVVDNYGQKLINSGYGIDQVRRVIVGGLTGYEKRVKLSKDCSSSKWRPHHEGAA